MRLDGFGLFVNDMSTMVRYHKSWESFGGSGIFHSGLHGHEVYENMLSSTLNTRGILWEDLRYIRSDVPTEITPKEEYMREFLRLIANPGKI